MNISVAFTRNMGYNETVCNEMSHVVFCLEGKKRLKTSDFYYNLPAELIAQTPLQQRDSSRLLVLHKDTGELEHKQFFSVPDHLRPGDCLVMNDSRVLPARLLGHRPTGGAVEILLLTQKELQIKNGYIKDAVAYVRKHYAEEISNVTAAEKLDINSAYFCRLFKKETGYTFGQYLTNYRIHVAAGLLTNFDMRINEVAMQVGIPDSNYFSQVFKKIMGMTPKEYQDAKKVF